MSQAGDEKNSEIRALINLLSGTTKLRHEERKGGRGASSDEIFVGLSSLSRGLTEAAREFKVLPRRPTTDERLDRGSPGRAYVQK